MRSLDPPTFRFQTPSCSRRKNQEYSYKFFITTTDKQVGNQEGQSWTSGTAPDGHGHFEPFIAGPLEGAGEPNLGFGRPDTFGQKEQALGTAAGMLEKGKDVISRITHTNLSNGKDEIA